MKRKIAVLFLILALFSGCVHKAGVRSSDLAKLNAIRDAYNTAYTVLTAELAEGKITKEQWNSQIVPKGTAVHDAIDGAYLALEVYNVNQTEDAKTALLFAIGKAAALLADYQGVVGGAQ